MPDSNPSALLSLDEHLSKNSTPYVDPLARINWQALEQNQYWLPETGLSLYGSPAYQRLSDPQRRRLSQFEFLHLVSAGLWLESVFMLRISQSLANDSSSSTLTSYHLHELREEAGHSLMFLELIQRSGLTRPANRFFKLRWANLIARHVPLNSSFFWVAVLVGETLPDSFNRYILQHRSEVCRTIYDITHIHVVDEARHTSHAENILKLQLETQSSWYRFGLRPIMNRVIKQFVDALFYPTAEIYDLAGLTNSRNWELAARQNPYRQQLVTTLTRRALTLLKELGIGIGTEEQI